ncbi:type IV secretion system protein [Agrobacterium sp. SHOUNA12C]|jgi:type IV secretion system protein VirB6|nr:type IV secretion system protein [Agrobacterium sp. BETTINA12B]MCJ9755084.1 type IV secretion system protein [Agrobacterium sp. SHOUNA12C]NTG05091.1 type IV secretion system protein [Rhizobium rhizogenes]
MGLVEQIGTTIDTSLVDYAQTVFTGVSGPITLLLNSMALIGLMFIALNHILQFSSVNYSMYFHWLLRYLLVYAFATMWANFQGIYTIFMEVPNDYSALMLKAVALHISMAGTAIGTNMIDPSLIHDTYSAMDEFGHCIVWIAYDFLRDTSLSNIGKSIENVFLGALILCIGGFFLAACSIIIIVAKVGFAVAISLAPLAIIMLMMEQTKHHFESWLRFTIGFVVVPLLTAALMAVVLYVAGEVLAGSGYTAHDKDKIFGFLFIMIAALVLLFQLPTMASTLASASVAAVGGGAAVRAYSMTKNTMSSAYSKGQRGRDAVGVMRQARKSGASIGQSVNSGFSAFRQSAAMRNDRRDRRLAGRISGPENKSTSAPRRYQGSGGGASGGSSGGGQDTPEQQNLNRDS